MAKTAVWVVLGVLGTVAGAAAETWFVQSERATVLAEPRFGAAPVAELGRGAEFELERSQGRWVQVSVAGADGWLPRLVVGDHPPLGPVRYLEKEGEQLHQQARRRASTASSAGATRGLQQGTRQRGTRTTTPTDYRAVEQVDAQQPGQPAVEAFRSESLPAAADGDDG